MITKIKKSYLLPDLTKIKEIAIRQLGIDLGRMIIDTFRDIYDDINKIVPEVVNTLPTASAEYYQRIMIRKNAGALDTVYLCVFHSGTSVYSWKQIT